MTEAKFTTAFHKWLARHSEWYFTCVFELKVEKDAKSIAFTRLADHQARALKLAQEGRIIYKIPDEGLSQKPFDSFMICNASAYVVLWMAKWDPKKFWIIPYKAWEEARTTCGRASVTRKMADDMGLSYELNS